MAATPNYAFLEQIRLATLDDLPRIAEVAAAGFYHSPVFRLQRPFHALFPEDTFANYYCDYRSMMLSQNDAVIVTEHTRNPAETDNLYDALKQYMSEKSKEERATDKVIVGVCSVALKPGSWRSGHFQQQSKADGDSHGFISQDRDIDTEAVRRYANATRPAKAQISGGMRVGTLVVHPAYWCQGFAARLVKWCTSIADADDIPLGVCAAELGVSIFKKAGFEEQATVTVPRLESTGGHSPHSSQLEFGEDVKLWIGVRRPIPTISQDIPLPV